MNSSPFRFRPARAHAATPPLHFSHRTPVTLATTVGVFTLAHFTAQMLLAVFCMIHWLIRFSLDMGFLCTLPFELGFSQMPGGQSLLVLLQPLSSLPLPDWLWQTPLTAFLLAALNSLLWGLGLGTLVCGVWSGCRRLSHSVAAPVRSSRPVASLPTFNAQGNQ
jgi:hypothetical protein